MQNIRQSNSQTNIHTHTHTHRHTNDTSILEKKYFDLLNYKTFGMFTIQ